MQHCCGLGVSVKNKNIEKWATKESKVLFYCTFGDKYWNCCYILIIISVTNVDSVV